VSPDSVIEAADRLTAALTVHGVNTRPLTALLQLARAQQAELDTRRSGRVPKATEEVLV
jgi:hypothetical protein